MRLLTAFLVAASIPGAAQSQSDRWVANEPGNGSGVSAITCPMDSEGGDFICLFLGCPVGGALEWGFAVAPAWDSAPRVTMAFVVDGAPAGSVALESRPGEDQDVANYAAPYVIARDGATLKALRRGRTATLVLGGALEFELPLALRGASAAIGYALENCRAR